MGVESTLPDDVQKGCRAADYPLRAVFNAVRYVVRGGIPWPMTSKDLPPRNVVFQQMRRWMDSGCSEMTSRFCPGCCANLPGAAQPTAVVLDSRMLQSTPEPGARAGYARQMPSTANFWNKCGEDTTEDG